MARNKWKLLLMIICGISFHSCDFTEDCVYFGTLRVTIDRSEFEPDLSAPSVNELSIILFPLNGDGVSNLKADPIPFNTENWEKELWIGDYDMVLYNPANYVLKDSENSKEARLTVNTVLKEDKRYITQEVLPAYLAGKELIHISHEDTTSVVLTPTLFVQQIDFKIRIKNMINSQVYEVSTVLDGVATGKYILSRGITSDYASMEIPALRQEGEKELFYQSVFVLGMNNTVPNNFRIELKFNDHHDLFTTIDLSDKFKNFTSKKVTVEIEVETGEFSTSGNLTNWTEVDWGELHSYN